MGRMRWDACIMLHHGARLGGSTLLRCYIHGRGQFAERGEPETELHFVSFRGTNQTDAVELIKCGSNTGVHWLSSPIMYWFRRSLSVHPLLPPPPSLTSSATAVGYI